MIPAIKAQWPEFRFIAEAYWDLEWELQQQGFDYCYDKKLYDRMEHGRRRERAPAPPGRSCLPGQAWSGSSRTTTSPGPRPPFRDGKGRAAAVAILTLPGAKLLHEGQFEGRKVRLPVFLGRRPAEPVDHDLAAFYGRLLKATNRDVFRNGEWRLCERSGWPDNQSCLNILAWCWVKDDERCLIVVNFGPDAAQARVHVPWDELRGRQWRLNDVLSGDSLRPQRGRDAGRRAVRRPGAVEMPRLPGERVGNDVRYGTRGQGRPCGR